MGASQPDTKDQLGHKGMVTFCESGHLNPSTRVERWSLTHRFRALFGNQTRDSIIITRKIKRQADDPLKGWNGNPLLSLSGGAADKEQNPIYLFILTIFVQKLLNQKFRLLPFVPLVLLHCPSCAFSQVQGWMQRMFISRVPIRLCYPSIGGWMDEPPRKDHPSGFYIIIVVILYGNQCY